MSQLLCFGTAFEILQPWPIADLISRENMQRSWIWGNVHHDGKPNPSLLPVDKEQFHQFLVATLPCRSFGAMTAVTLAFETYLMRTHPGSLLSSLSSHHHVFGFYWWSPGHKLPQTLINLLNLCCQQCSCFWRQPICQIFTQSSTSVTPATHL